MPDTASRTLSIKSPTPSPPSPARSQSHSQAGLHKGPYTTVPASTPDRHLTAEDKAALFDPDALPTVQDLVAKLLSPPLHIFTGQPNIIYVSMEWVLKQVDGRHFFVDPMDGMRYLHLKSKIFTHGKQAGLPEEYYRWLCEHQLERREGDPTVPSRFEYFPLRADLIRRRA